MLLFFGEENKGLKWFSLGDKDGNDDKWVLLWLFERCGHERKSKEESQGAMGEAERRVLDKRKKKRQQVEKTKKAKEPQKEPSVSSVSNEYKGNHKKERDEKKGTVVSDAKKRQNRGGLDWTRLKKERRTMVKSKRKKGRMDWG